jgi:tripartite-type tricarboxylate transporter receptor subunit TctC
LPQEIADSQKTGYYFKRIETQAELDALLRADYEDWVQYRKDAGAWEE